MREFIGAQERVKFGLDDLRAIEPQVIDGFSDVRHPEGVNQDVIKLRRASTGVCQELEFRQGIKKKMPDISTGGRCTQDQRAAPELLHGRTPSEEARVPLLSPA